MKKVLIVSTVSRQFYLFEQANIRVLRKLGYEVHGVANFDDRSERLKEVNVVEHHIPFQRSPFSPKNVKAYKELLALVEKEQFDVIHCHAPVGGVLARLVGKKFPKAKVIYTAHGFHFYKGASKLNWLLFYPVEKWLSKYTDQLIVINHEDFNIANSKFKMKALDLVSGIGVNFDKFKPATPSLKSEKRAKLGFKDDDKILIYVGELSKRKNQKVLITAMADVVKDYPNAYLLLVGRGALKAEYKELIASLGLEKNVRMLGYRDDIATLMQLSDVALSSSTQEGLPVNLMEALGTGLPLVVSNCRGNSDLVENGVNGQIVSENEAGFWSQTIINLLGKPQVLAQYGVKSLEKSKLFSEEEVMQEMQEIYSK